VGCKDYGLKNGYDYGLLFYLNYVGCKAYRGGGFVVNTPSFTLTMWDVKFEQGRSGPTAARRFTLTMWDVKQ